MDYDSFFEGILSALPGVLGALLILVLAIILATILKKLLIKGLEKVDFSSKLQKWGMAKNDEEGGTFLETIGSVIYFLVLLFFLPVVLNGLNVGGVMNPIVNMFDKFFGYIPNIVLAILILVIGAYFCKFIKRLVKNLLSGLNVDKWYAKVTGQSGQVDVDDQQLNEVIATIIYILIFIPILTVALETLGIQSISAPIISMLNSILAAIPNIITAAVLLVVGGFIAKLVGDLVENLLATTGVNKFSKYLNFKEEAPEVTISVIAGGILKAVLFLFFLVEAISVLKLEVLNTIGSGIIAYLPLVLSAVVILAIALIGGNIFANFIAKATGNSIFAEITRYTIIVVATFMVLEQLQIAQTIVNTAFVIVLGSAGVAVALAFGLGGRDFAAKQLDKANQAIEDEDNDGEHDHQGIN